MANIFKRGPLQDVDINQNNQLPNAPRGIRDEDITNPENLSDLKLESRE